MSKVPIVARRRRSQLATTVPVLTPPGKPSTWFPGEGLVTQAQMFYLLSNMLIQKSVCVINVLYMSFHVIFMDCRSPPRMPASYHRSRTYAAR